ncbi:MAG: ABC transporter substrate-binding protein [Oculatellaceae cyanobacterium Prado106]|jgi:NitT/TauT family transport system substrate-binding protein|nr:ABC transporter substrate-binding protein [Oculatellaceae cyanobacterium Prado106]
MSQHPMKWTLLKAGFVTACLLFVTSCQTNIEATVPTAESPTTAAQSEPKQLKKVRFTLSWLLQGVDAPLTLAMERGYFAEEGVEVEFSRGFGSSDTAGKIAAGQYDLGFGDMYSMIEFNQKNPDQKLVAVAVPYNRAPYAIISLKDRNITSPKELAGKKLGAPAGDTPRRLWRIFADSTGVEPNSVNWVTMEPRLRESFLLKGEVDAISGFIYSMLPSLVKGGKSLNDLNIFYYKENGLDFYGNAVLVKESFLKENPDLVKSFLAAYLRGLQDTLKDPEAGLESVLAKGDQTMSRDAEKLRLKLAVDNFLVNPEVEKNGLGAVDPVRFEQSIQQTVQGFGLSQTPAIKEVFNSDFLPPLSERQAPAAAERKSLE